MISKLPGRPYGVLALAVLMLLVLAAGLLLGQPSQAQQSQQEEVPDADCPGPRDSILEANKRFAQTFTAENSGELTRAQLEIGSTAGGEDFLLEIRTVDESGTPTDTVLASAQVNDVPNIPSGQVTTITGNFNPGAPVEAGEQYALSVTSGENQAYAIGARITDPCPGQAFADSFGDGNFSPLSGSDLVFATFVTLPNGPPVAEDDSYRVKKNKTLTVKKPGVLENDSDPDGDGLRARLVSGPSDGTLDLNRNGSFTYEPDRNFEGRDSFIYEARDGNGGTDTAKVTIRIVR